MQGWNVQAFLIRILFLTVFMWLGTFCDHMIFRSAHKAFPSWTIRFFLDEVPAERAFSFSFLIFLKHFSTEWLLSPQCLHFIWTELASSLCILDPERLLSRFKSSACKDEMFKNFWSGYFSSLLNYAWWLANLAEYFPLWWKLSRNVCIIWSSEYLFPTETNNACAFWNLLI